MSMGLRRDQIIMVTVLFAGTFLAVLNLTVLSPALPTIMKDMSVDATTVQWLTSGYSLVEAIVIPLSAYLMGRFSTRQLFIGGFIIFVVGSLLITLSQAFWMMLLGRVLQAACTGFVMPMVATLVMLIFPREKRGSAMGLMTLIVGFAPALGPSISGLLVDSVGWRSMFLIVTILSVVITVFSFIVLKNFEGLKRGSFDALSVVLSTLGLLGVLYGLSTFASTDNMPLTIGLIIAGAVLLVLFTRRQMHLKSPMLKVTVLKARKYRTAVIIIALIQAALVGSGVIIPIYIQQGLGYSATVSGLAMLPGAVVGAIMGMLAGRWFDRVGARPLAIVGGIIMVVGGILGVFFTLESPIWFVALGNFVMSCGLQMVITPTNTWGINSLENSVIQHGNALANTINQVGGSFGTALLVSISALSAILVPNAAPLEQLMYGDHIAFTVTAAFLVVNFLLIVVLVRDRASERNKAYSPDAGAEVERTIAGHPLVKVREVMNAETGFLPSTASIREVMSLMSRTETGGVPLVDDDMRLVGFITDGDIVKYLGKQDSSIPDALTKGYLVLDDQNLRDRLTSLIKLNAMDIATRKVVTVDAEMPLDDACRFMADMHLKKVPVVEDGRMIGAISNRNIIHALVSKTELDDRAAW